MTYVRRQSDIQVFEYQHQHRDEWPAWLRDYSVYTEMTGAASVAVDAIGIMLIPNRENFSPAKPGDYVVNEGGVVSAYTAKQFAALFEEQAAE